MASWFLEARIPTQDILWRQSHLSLASRKHIVRMHGRRLEPHHWQQHVWQIPRSGNSLAMIMIKQMILCTTSRILMTWPYSSYINVGLMEAWSARVSRKYRKWRQSPSNIIKLGSRNWQKVILMEPNLPQLEVGMFHRMTCWKPWKWAWDKLRSKPRRKIGKTTRSYFTQKRNWRKRCPMWVVNTTN